MEFLLKKRRKEAVRRKQQNIRLRNAIAMRAEEHMAEFLSNSTVHSDEDLL